MLRGLGRAQRGRTHLQAALAALQDRCKATLAFEEVTATPAGGSTDASAEPVTAAIVHGLLGQGRNWRSWARKLAATAAEMTQRPWSILLVDQRCHGASAKLDGFALPHTLAASASDIAELMHKRTGAGPDMLIGHSLGGKVMLQYLAQGGTAGLPLPKQVWVLDSNPGLLPTDRSDVARVMTEIGKIPVPLRSRDDMIKHLQGLGFSEGLRLWLGSNLANDRSAGGLTWTFRLDGAHQLYEDYKATEFWSLLGNPPPGVTLNLVRAANSDRWTKGMEDKLQQAADEAAAGGADKGTLKLHTLPDAGHWLHVDNPDGLLDMVSGGCQDAAANRRH